MVVVVVLVDIAVVEILTGLYVWAGVTSSTWPFWTKLHHFYFWFALCYRTDVLSVCPVCLSVTLVYCGQAVRWIRMPFGTEVDLVLGDIVLDGDPAPPKKRAQQPPSLFGPLCSGTVAHLSNSWVLVSYMCHWKYFYLLKLFTSWFRLELHRGQSDRQTCCDAQLDPLLVGGPPNNYSRHFWRGVLFSPLSVFFWLFVCERDK